MVLSVGGLEPSKGHQLLIDAVGAMDPTARPHVVIVFNREQPGYRQQILRSANEAAVGLTLRVGITTTELVRLYQEALFTFCGAAGEPFGLTPLESAACGTPVIAIRAGGYLDTVSEGANGVLVNPDPPSIRSAVESAAAGELPRGASVRRSILPYWTWDSAAERFATALDACLQAKA
jgi:glycosyltransferase involved in cell wall biosynthesis